MSKQIDLSDAIVELASGPKKATGDSGSIEQHSIKDLIDADRYFASKKAAEAGFGRIKLSKIVPDGASE